MSYRQLAALFICNLMPFIAGNSLMSLLPIYISDELGAGSVAAGVAIATAFAALSISTNLTAAVGRRFRQRRDLITLTSLICMPVVWLLGETEHVVVFTVLLGVVWFFGGMQLAMTQILTALLAEKYQRGRTFGILATAGPLSMLIGGLTAGQLVDRWGFDALFVFCALLYGVSLLISRLIAATRKPPQQLGLSTSAGLMAVPVLLLVMGASVLAHIASFTISMTRPLAMDALHFDAAAITSTVAISGAVTVMLPIIAGWLSDRIGRKPLFVGVYLLTMLGAGLFAVAGVLWQFWVAQAFVSVLGSSMVIGAALVTDIVPQAQIDTAVARFSATPWIGAVIGSLSAGLLVDALGTQLTFMLAAGLVAAAVGVALGIRQPRDRMVAGTLSG